MRPVMTISASDMRATVTRFGSCSASSSEMLSSTWHKVSDLLKDASASFVVSSCPSSSATSLAVMLSLARASSTFSWSRLSVLSAMWLYCPRLRLAVLISSCFTWAAASCGLMRGGMV